MASYEVNTPESSLIERLTWYSVLESPVIGGGDMTVTFRAKGEDKPATRYEYLDVPEDTFHAVADGEVKGSIGLTFNALVRGKFETHKL